MIFSSVEFFVFFAIVLAALAMCRREEPRRNVLLVASYGFYAWWDWRFSALLAGSTLVDYYVALRIEAEQDDGTRRRWLLLSLIVNLGLLGFFKYTTMVVSTAHYLLGGESTLGTVDIILPVGISFYTFQTLSYTIDVFRGRLQATRDLRDYALFVSFFPQLVAGPIVRGRDFLPQLQTQHPLRRSNLRSGAELFIKGFAKKVLFADTLAFYADPVFSEPSFYSSPTVALAVLAYSFQIYYDFSGYSDMAIGVGRMLGFELPENFRHPYLARSITEFWHRWHVSLSTWLRDYLYISLGGNRRGTRRTYANLLITMILGGLWHGASWRFLMWGAVHGVALAAHRASLELRRRSGDDFGSSQRQWLGWATTFLFVSIAWVPFRAPSFGHAWTMLKKLAFQDTTGADWYYVYAVGVMICAAVLHVIVLYRPSAKLLLPLHRPIGWVALIFLLLAILLVAPLDTSPFIYFQF